MPSEKTLFVCSLEEMPAHVRALRPGYLVSILRDEEQPPTPPEIMAGRHLRITVDDICEPTEGHVCPDPAHVAELIEFIAGWPGDEPLLVHCFAGISRSMAAALIALGLDGSRADREIARYLRLAAPHAQPNRRIVTLADHILGRGGRLVAACAGMGIAQPMLRGPLVRLTLPA